MRGYAGGGFGLLLWLVYYYYVYGLSVMMSCMLLSVGLWINLNDFNILDLVLSLGAGFEHEEKIAFKPEQNQYLSTETCS